MCIFLQCADIPIIQYSIFVYLYICALHFGVVFVVECQYLKRKNNILAVIWCLQIEKLTQPKSSKGKIMPERQIW